MKDELVWIFVICDSLKIENNEIKYEDGNIVKLLFHFLCYREFLCFFMNWNMVEFKACDLLEIKLKWNTMLQSYYLFYYN